MNTLDIFTRDIIQNSLQAIADEMFSAMRNAAMSPVIYEVLDMGTGITDAQGEIASSGAGIPAFVGVLDKAVKKILLHHPQTSDIEDGDVFISNDPHDGAVTHLNDVVLAMPVFANGQLVAWTANIAHWNDVGGRVPGSLSTDATDIFQEGLRLASVKLISKGQPIRSVLQILHANTRMPDFMEGDLWAGVAAVRNGAKRLRELNDKYGSALFLLAMKDFMDLGEKVSLKALATLPAGQFSLEEVQDDGSVFKVRIDIRDTELVIDLRDNPDQCLGPTNLSRDGAVVAAQMAFKALTAPQGITNGGTFRPLRVLTRPGSLFDAQLPAAEGFYFENLIRVHDLILCCLAQQFPDRLPAGNFASVCATIIGGVHPETGRMFTLVEPEIGGWGADSSRDGNNAVYSGLHGETYNCPVEVCEARYGLYVEQLALNDEPGGHGQFRGGRGICIDYRILADGSFMTCGYTRSVIPPWGLEQGAEGTPNYVEVVSKDGERQRYSMASGITLNAGDLVKVRTGAGGGYGCARQRDPAAVRDDLKNGYVDAASAHSVYGLTI
ncbi:hydantoinase B/oxoprolinase family protein [Pseudomonas reactans]|jgi:N-methylhydantoinase B